MNDETAQELSRLQTQVRVISEVTRSFAEATTHYEQLLESVARCLAETLDDLCVVFLLDEGDASLTACSMHATEPAALEQLQQSFATRRLQLAAQPALERVLKSGQALLVPRLEELDEASPERLRWQQQLGLHTAVVVPIQVQGRSIGAVVLGRYKPRSPSFEPQDLELARSLTGHAGLAIENAKLYAAAEQARRNAERVQDSLRRSEEAQRQFFESSPLAAFVVAADTLEILTANAAALELYGYPKDEFLGLRLPDLRYPADQELLSGVLKAVGTDDTRGPARHQRKDGSLIHVDGGSHLATYEGRPARFVMLSDQTKRVQAELERDHSEQRLHRTLDEMKEGYTIMSRDLRYLYVNRAGAEQTHLTRKQLLGHTPMELYPDFRGSKIHEALQAAAERGESRRVEEELLHADGEVGYFELNIQPVPEGIVVLSIDQTERRRAENRRDSLEGQLRQSQKMEAVGRLAGGIAHDFNNVLSIILGYSEDILASFAPQDPRHADLKEIRAAANRAGELTKQLLMFSRQQVLEPKVLDLNEVLVGVERMLARVLGEHLELVILPDARLGRIRADRGNVEQVIMNLAVNARDAMPDGGRLTIETSNVVVDEAFARQHVGIKSGQYVFMGVTDSGVGMDQRTRGQIFEPFFSTKELGKGTGLGLSTVHGIVQQSGGAVYVYSEPGHGTTFKVYLPRVDAELDTRPPTLPPAVLRGSETVLLVEDEEAVREVARRILERHGYHVLLAPSAAEAVALGDRHDGRIHLLLTDVVMPHSNGAQLAAQLRPKRPDLKVLYMSGYTDRGIGAQGVLDDGSAFLQKPFSSELLARKVRSVLDDSLS